jgi:hypothetical protein
MGTQSQNCIVNLSLSITDDSIVSIDSHKSLYTP